MARRCSTAAATSLLFAQGLDRLARGGGLGGGAGGLARRSRPPRLGFDLGGASGLGGSLRVAEAGEQRRALQGADFGGEPLVLLRLARLAAEPSVGAVSSSAATSSSRSRLASAALSRRSASWRRVCRPETPAASSRMRRRFDGLAAISSEICPWRTRAGELAPVEASANRSCTSRARTSWPLMR